MSNLREGQFSTATQLRPRHPSLSIITTPSLTVSNVQPELVNMLNHSNHTQEGWGRVRYWGGYVPQAPLNSYPVPGQHLVEF